MIASHITTHNRHLTFAKDRTKMSETTTEKRKTMSVLKFELMDVGKWDAYSAIHDDGSSFEWRIKVTDDGMFSVASSDKELLASVPPNFSAFADAIEWCESHEKTMTGELLMLPVGANKQFDALENMNGLVDTDGNKWPKLREIRTAQDILHCLDGCPHIVSDGSGGVSMEWRRWGHE